MTVVGRFTAAMVRLVGYLAVLAGMPAVVWRGVGWPLPHSLPTWSQTTAWLSTSQMSTNDLLDVLAVGFWMVWAYFVLCVLVEAAYQIRHRASPRMLLAGPLQAIAADLVAFILIGLSSSGLRHGGPAPITDTTLAVSIHAGASPTRAATAGSSPPFALKPATALPSASTTPYTVRRGDSEWSIAGRTYGDPRRWPKIWDENEGRLEPDGRQFTNPSLILPGWTLDLPDLTPAAPPSTAPAPQVPEPPPSPAPPSTAAAQATAPSPAPAPAAPEALSPPRARPATAEPPQPPAAAPAPPAARSGSWIDLPLGGRIGLSLATVLAAAVTMARLRARARRRVGGPALDGQVDTLVGPTLRTAIRAAESEAAPEDTHDEGPTPVRPLPHQVVEGTLDEVPGLAPVAEQPGEDPREVVAGVHDLTGLAVCGPGARDALRHILVSVMAHNPALRTHLLLNGATADLVPDLGDVPGVRVVPSVREQVDLLEAEMVHRSRLLRDRDADDYRQVAGSDDPVGALLAVVDGSHAAAVEPAVRMLAGFGGRLGLGVVALGHCDGLQSVEIADDGRVVGSGAGVLTAGCRLGRMTTEEAAEAARALAASRSDVIPSPADGISGAGPEAAGDSGPAADDDDEHALRPVQLLLFGPPRLMVGDAEVERLRPRTLPLLTLLALRRFGLTSEELIDLVWYEDGDETADRHRVNNTISVVRERSAALAGRPLRVIDHRSSRFRLFPEDVDTDVWVFTAALAAAEKASDPAERTRALERATAVVTGEPLEGVSYSWAEEERASLRRRAVDACCLLAELREAAGDADAAVAALERALRVEPYQEDLYRLLIGVHQRKGRPDAARRAYQQCVAALAGLGLEPDAETRGMMAAGRPHAAWSPALDAPSAQLRLVRRDEGQAGV